MKKYYILKIYANIKNVIFNKLIKDNVIYIFNIDEDKQIPKKFYSRLDAAEDPSKWQDLTTYPALRSSIGNEEEKNILDKLARNIKIIITEYSGNTKKRCRDVNHWINEKIKTLEGKKLGSDVRPYSYSVFNDVKWNGINSEKVCDRDDKLYSSLNAELMKELDDYCEIRDNNGCNISIDNNDCLKCNKYVNKKKQEFTRKMQCICDKTNCIWKDYTINANCTLNNMNLTFPEINCKGLSKEEELQESVTVIKKYSPLEIGFFILVFFILFYLFILFLEKVK
ncbi:hypothetical protein PVMG_04860 [Plasmodium vivax Mauritania I]|uniref:Uncharacterized protein n=1 Tax=Plasmodium vivax Mauritania I TaxID=1035515 RepID=A0A0J9VU21_PLAVI|nr:hypothetical protein PVMG_04860 [Plasmodium vivax Mauritania I]